MLTTMILFVVIYIYRCNACEASMEVKKYYPDKDGDGYGDANSLGIQIRNGDPVPDGYVEKSGDCDDNDPAINPGAKAIPGNAVDENCAADIDGTKQPSQSGMIIVIVGLVILLVLVFFVIRWIFCINVPYDLD